MEAGEKKKGKMSSKSKPSERHPDRTEPKPHPNPSSSNPVKNPLPRKNPNPKSSKTPNPRPSSPKSSDPMTPDDPASPSRKSDRKRKARDFSDDEPSAAAKSPQAGQRRLADDNAVAILRAAIDFRCRTGSIPFSSNMPAFYDSVKASLPAPLTREQVYNKLRRLRLKFQKANPPGSGPHDVLVHELSTELWGAEDKKDDTKDEKKAKKGTLVADVVNGDAADEEEEPEEEGNGEEQGGCGPDSLPFVSSVAAEHWKVNGLWGATWEEGLKRMDPSKARALEEKWRRQLGDEMKLQMDWSKMTRELLTLLNDAHRGDIMPCSHTEAGTGYGVGVIPTQLSAMSRYTRVRRLEQEIEEMGQKHADDRATMIKEMRQSYADDRAAMDSIREHIERLTFIALGAPYHGGQSSDLSPVIRM